MARSYPPFSALRAFEATARLGKQTDAAAELRITTSAISHQIRALEAYLGITLFDRTPNGVALTPVGIRYFNRISNALDTISEATEENILNSDIVPLKIHMYPSLANLWFIPNLSGFSHHHPTQRVTVVTQPHTVVLSGSDIDCAIVYGKAPPQSNYIDLLFDEVMIPVCSPRTLNDYGTFETPHEVLNQQLISSTLDCDEWTMWARGCGIEQPVSDPHLIFDNRSNGLKAAQEGLGIAMDRRPFGELQKTCGQLVTPVPNQVSTGWSYYFVSSERSHSLDRVRKMRRWLKTICAVFGDSQ